MGNIELHCVAEQLSEKVDNGHLHNNVVEEGDFSNWCKHLHKKYGFPKPCSEYHSSDTVPYSCANCYSLEVKVSRRRSVQFRHDLHRYIVDLERLNDGRHSVHIRDFISGTLSVIPLIHVGNNLPELDYMHEPILTVIAYHGPMLVLSVQEKSKNIPKVLLFCNVKEKREVGGFVAQLNYNNLSGVLLDCCICPDNSTFLLSILEDHYDQFQVTYKAIKFASDCKPQILCTERFNQVWYEPSLLLQFLPDCDNRYIVGLGENPAGLTHSDTRRYLFIYDLVEGQITRGIVLQDCLYPVCLSVSGDGQWIATMFRDPCQQATSADIYSVRLYLPGSLTCQLQKSLLFTSNGFTSLSNCNKLVFSGNNRLLALPSVNVVDDVYVDSVFGSFYSPEVRGIDKVTMTVHWLPCTNINLKDMCRDIILSHCSFANVPNLPVPPPVKAYLQFLA